jgi:hypothetical protein
VTKRTLDGGRRGYLVCMPKNTPAESARIGAMTRRIVSLYGEATAEDQAHGLAWYGRAMDAAETIAEGSSLTPNAVAGIIAALSPRCRWATNVAWAADVVAAFDRGDTDPPKVHTTAMRRVAWAIANGEHPEVALKGPKTRRFWANIIGDEDVVTVDVWAVRAATGERSPKVPAGRWYDQVERAYVNAGRILGIAPRTVQAAVWVHVRGAAD